MYGVNIIFWWWIFVMKYERGWRWCMRPDWTFLNYTLFQQYIQTQHIVRTLYCILNYTYIHRSTTCMYVSLQKILVAFLYLIWESKKSNKRWHILRFTCEHYFDLFVSVLKLICNKFGKLHTDKYNINTYPRDTHTTVIYYV